MIIYSKPSEKVGNKKQQKEKVREGIAMSTKRELVLKAFHKEKTDRIPVGFWHHYLDEIDFNEALNRPELLEKNIAGHKKFKEEFDPDFVKIMTDGLFYLPYEARKVESAEELKALQPIPKDHEFFAKNEELVRRVREIYGEDVLLFFNEFSPYNQLLQIVGGLDRVYAIKRVHELLEEDAAAVAQALDVIADSLNELSARVIKPGLADGLYLSVNNPNRSIPAQIYSTFIAPSEIKVLEAANKLAADNILHICGYQGNTNILSVYENYPANIINWAVFAEGVGLAEGKKLFHDKAVIGGFGNTKDSVLYKGTKEEIEKYVEDLLASVGKEGIIIGADCTVPADIDVQRLNWVREKAANI